MKGKPSFRHVAKELPPEEWEFCLAGKVEDHDLADCWGWEILREKRHNLPGLVAAAHEYRRSWQDWLATRNPTTGLGNPFDASFFGPVMPASLLALMEADKTVHDFHSVLSSPYWPEKAWLASNRKRPAPSKEPMKLRIDSVLLTSRMTGRTMRQGQRGGSRSSGNT